ncbi:transcriptional regulator, AbrB family [Rhizobium sp. RU35A]|uniref:AbrB/MazE/SpoVT family DNA-binding domain-containing protein n=1 Tax=Rhizobium straminoryzae TaxID=1387186 RepID=A0A549T7F9_9HYPH|nr:MULTISPECIES: AbrB/MazE/SpoVT family DNA-binding domain-containing protein [Rhizobium]TRL37790.1 AbrB/MazE/SpoVT family DNA-binding domain-containing protein [Rhizobium straminoryzae]SIQ94228.1 transcriptional regulator, AbrB family [Rhizobium sp. RU35A]
MTSTVTARGQVTIPKELRDRLGLQPGSRVDVREGPDGVLTLTPLGAPQSSIAPRFALLRGHAGQGLSTGQILAMTR